MHRIVVDVQTGEVTEVQLTPAEIAELESRPEPEPPQPLTTEQKLEAIGLTIAELREALEAAEP